MYAICSQYMKDSTMTFEEFVDMEDEFVDMEDSTMTFAKFVTVCQKYAETALLGEFDSKWNLFLVFHCRYASQRPQTCRTCRLSEY